MRADLCNVTFNIPVLIDSPERLENVKIVTDYLLNHFDTNIIVFEAYRDAPCIDVLDDKVERVQKRIGQGPFHRTQYLNEMARMSNTDVVVNYDCDVIFHPQNYINATRGIIEQGIPAVFPYDGRFLDVDRSDIPKLTACDFDNIEPSHLELLSPRSTGGAIFWSYKDFVAGGMENENFISWGYEDRERVYRFKTLGYRMVRIPGPLYHLTHRRSYESNAHNPHYINNKKLYHEMIELNATQLKEYIAKQSWIKNTPTSEDVGTYL